MYVTEDGAVRTGSPSDGEDPLLGLRYQQSNELWGADKLRVQVTVYIEV